METTSRRCCTSSGRRAETVMQFGAEGFEIGLLVKIGKPAIEAEADLQIGDKSFRNQHRGSHIDLRRPGAFSLLHFPTRAHLDHGFFQHGLVEFVAHFADVAGLLLAQDVAGAADIEVVTGQREACAQRVERLQDFQPPVGGSGDGTVGRCGHQGE